MYLLMYAGRKTLVPFIVSWRLPAGRRANRRPGFEIRRKISFSLVTGGKNFGIFRKISVLKFKIQKNSDKIHRNFGTEFRYRGI